MSNAPVILYGYDASPFATKVKNLLLIKKIPHKRVDVAMVLPRPEITDALGIKYRRIPILAIGNDVYCDTSLISDVLERRFPASEGYGTLFPPRVGSNKADTGLAKAIAVYWNDKIVFPLGGNSLPYGRLGASFIKDRSQWAGVQINPKELADTQGVRTSTLSSHLALVEEQLSDGRQWLLDTEKPGLVDIDVHFLLSWLQTFKNLKEIFDPSVVPNLAEWIARTTAYLKELEQSKVATFEKISADVAAKTVASSSYEDEKVVGFVEAEAKRLGVALGDIVSVIPTDNAKIPTVGRLISLNRREFAIEVVGTAGKVRVHFPRLEFSLRVEKPSTSSKL